ncbi:MAG TPA: radical SAM protein [Polyangiales bacterium]|nr:radical SAM protein [Polyangiales bacterium]
MNVGAYHQEIRSRLNDEVGTIYRDAPDKVALLYPSPYHVAMSSLGYQTMYREINNRPGCAAERAFLPDDVDAHVKGRLPLHSYESMRPVSDFAVIGMSVAFELELAGVVQSLTLAGVPVLSEDRDDRHPFILCGGPLTFSNPLPLAPFADAILMGEADETIHLALDILFSTPDRAERLRRLAAEIPSCFVPALHGDMMPLGAKCTDALLPARAVIRTPNTELRNMFLIEAERGCSRGCAYCVMRRSTNGGMRIVPMETILSLIPEGVTKVGLVGAAVSDHPKICDIIETLADRGIETSLSSLRPDRLNERFIAALRKAGHTALTTASDGASQRLRDTINRKTREKNLVNAAQLARDAGMKRLKLYMMIGLPGELDEDVDELIQFGNDISKLIPLSLGIAPFVSKRNTPLDGLEFAGISLVEKRLDRLRRGARGRFEVRATSARWAWVEYVLAQGGAAEGRAVMQAVQAGGKFADYKRAFDALPRARKKRPLAVAAL